MVSFCKLFVLILLCAFVVVGKEVQATLAEDFIESIGVCTHWTYGDTPYGYAYANVSQLLVESGIRHYRDGKSDRIPDLGKRGVYSTLVLGPEDGSVADQITYISQTLQNNAWKTIVSIEGPNEPDLFWEKEHITYNNMTWKTGAPAYQRDLYAALKDDSITKSLTVFGIALGGTYDWDTPNPWAAGILTDSVDWGNFHPYGGGDPFSDPNFTYGGILKYWYVATHPMNKMGGTASPNDWMFKFYQPPYAPKPMGSTECGYSTFYSGSSELTLGKYIPRLYAVFYLLGVKRTHVYEFIDEFVDPNNTNREAHFGFLRRDLTKKPHYYSVQSLITTLSESNPDPKFVAGKLNYTLEVQPANSLWNRVDFVQELLLQKTNGVFYLLLWDEVTNEDSSVTPHKEIFPPPFPAKLQIADASQVWIWTYNLNTWMLEKKAPNIQDGIIMLDITDTLTIVEVHN